MFKEKSRVIWCIKKFQTRPNDRNLDLYDPLDQSQLHASARQWSICPRGRGHIHFDRRLYYNSPESISDREAFTIHSTTLRSIDAPPFANTILLYPVDMRHTWCVTAFPPDPRAINRAVGEHAQSEEEEEESEKQMERSSFRRLLSC